MKMRLRVVGRYLFLSAVFIISLHVTAAVAESVTASRPNGKEMWTIGKEEQITRTGGWYFAFYPGPSRHMSPRAPGVLYPFHGEALVFKVYICAVKDPISTYKQIVGGRND